MFKGIFYVLSACFVWGLIFVIPLLMVSYSSFEITIGRFFFYGLFSLMLFYFKRPPKLPWQNWLVAILSSLFATFIYYAALVFAIKYSNASLSALIIGISPIIISYFSNIKEKSFTLKNLIIPSMAILSGLLFLNLPAIMEKKMAFSYFMGIASAIISLISWCAVAIANANFLRKNKNISASDWATLLGLGAFMWTLFFIIAFFFFSPKSFNPAHYSIFNKDFLSFLTGSFILGSLCSWGGAFLWNKGTLLLPLPLVGQLSIFETIFGITYVFLFEMRWPKWHEALGIGLFLFAILYGLYIITRKEEQTTAS